MATKKKQRKAAARANYEAYLTRKAEQARRRKRRDIIIGVVVAVAIVVGFGVWTSVQGDDTPAPAAEPAASPSATPSASTSPKSYDKPEQVLNDKTPATATLKTNQGTITIDLDVKNAPKNSNSIAFLAGEGYFDNTSCHRLTTSDSLSVLQCGDPTGTGSGGPGYTVADENLPKAGKNNYPAGTVAMAEPQGGQAGSQFFLVYEDSTLPPDYTIVGHIDSGLDILRQVAQGGVAAGSPNVDDGAPATPVTIKSVTINQS